MLKRMESFFKLFSTHLACALLIFFAVFPQNISAKENHVVIISSGQSPAYKNLINNVIDEVHADDTITVSFDIIYLNKQSTDNNPHKIPAKTELIISIGKYATDIALATKSKAPILSTLLPRKSFHSSVSRHKTLQKNSTRKITSIHLDNPPIRQILLAKILFGESKTLSILTSEPDSGYIKSVKDDAADADINIHIEPVNPSDNIIKKLTYALNSSDVLLALPDARIFNRKTAQSILLTTYRHRTPVIAFSSAYTKAGALASVYSSPKQIAKHTSETLISIIKSRFTDIPNPTYPKYFSISINPNVARTFNVKQIDKADVYKKLLNLLGKRQ